VLLLFELMLVETFTLLVS